MGRLTRLAKNIYTGEIIPKGAFQEDYELLNLVYDDETKLVYYKFSERVADVISGRNFRGKVGYMAPYYGPNGKICRLENGQISEII